MSRIFDITKAVVITWALSAPVAAWASQGVIYDARGSVSVAKAPIGTEEINPRNAIISDTVSPGMMVLTGSNSYAVLKFDDGQIVIMQANSTLLVRDFTYFPLKISRSNIDLSLMKGGMRFVTGQIGSLNPAAFKLSTPNGTIRVRGTDFFAVMTNDGLYNKVVSGSISMTNAAGVSVLNAGKTTLTALATSLPVAVSATGASAAAFSNLAAIPVPKVQVAIAQPARPPAPVPAVPAVAAVAAVPAAAAVARAPAPGAAAVASAPVPAPAPAKAPVSTTTGTTTAAAGSSKSTAGGAAAGGAAAAPKLAVAETRIPWTGIAIGVGVAAGVAALAGGSSSTTQH